MGMKYLGFSEFEKKNWIIDREAQEILGGKKLDILRVNFIYAIALEIEKIEMNDQRIRYEKLRLLRGIF